MTRLLATIFLCLVATASTAAERLVVFSSKRCPACLQFANDYANDPRIAGDREVVIIDSSEQRDQASEFKIAKLPTFVLVNGAIEPANEQRRRVGYSGPTALKRWLNGGR